MQIVLYCIVFYNNVFRVMLLLEINFILSYIIFILSYGKGCVERGPLLSAEEDGCSSEGWVERGPLAVYQE